MLSPVTYITLLSGLYCALVTASPVAPKASGLKCYPRTDLDFFPPDPNPRTLLSTSCAVTLDTLSGNFHYHSNGSVTVWYTSDHVRPKELDARAQQLPIAGQVHACGLALLSTKALIDLTSLASIAWRPEWGTHDNKTAKEIITDVKPAQWLGPTGFAALLDCASDGGQAGHIIIRAKGIDEQLHAFIWSGGESKFSKVYDLLH